MHISALNGHKLSNNISGSFDIYLFWLTKGKDSPDIFLKLQYKHLKFICGCSIIDAKAAVG